MNRLRLAIAWGRGRVFVVAVAVAIACGLAAGCAVDPLPGPGGDFAVRLPVDMAAPDLAVPNLEFCRGTRVAGTCVQTFFAKAAQCFMPMGACTFSSIGYMVYDICWENGAKHVETGMSAPDSNQWLQNGAPCLSEQTDRDGNQFYSIGKEMLVHLLGGDVICPDGTRLHAFGPLGGTDCPALTQLVSTQPPPKCTFGMCR